MKTHRPTTIGYNTENKHFIFGDCAVTPSGKIILPSSDGIITINGHSFNIAKNHPKTYPNTETPLLFPYLKTTTNKQKIIENLTHPSPRHQLTSTTAVTLSRFLTDTTALVGKTQSLLLTFTILAYPLTPLIREKSATKLGIWIHGQKASGKNTLARVLMQMAGFPDYSHITFSKHPNTQQKTSQKINKSSNHFHIIPTTPSPITIITSETTLDKSARSRFISVESNPSKQGLSPSQQKFRLESLLAIAPELHTITRWIMMNLPEFTDKAEHFMEVWLNNDEIQKELGGRITTTYAAIYAAACAINQMLFQESITSPTALKSLFRNHLSKK